MSRCASCAQPIEVQHRYCPQCGSASDSSEMPTGTAPRRARSSTPSPLRTTGLFSGVTSPAAHGRFVAGTLLGGRYRVVGLLGKGGMGEVYRADDLRLEQPVALKFLPEILQDDRERLERFYREVRIARQISHPSVCRVYDVGEAEGLHFLSMEFVDGENLASLLRRIGRLPPAKALDIGRQICAGLGAAHQKGVLHRDVKPANVMLDGQGHARLMDFGLAGLMASFQGDEVRSGTPAYMAPEQLEGREVTARSEVYALGLLLYELFTGRKAFEGRTRAELLRAHREESPAHPSQLVPEIDPAVERVILHCLEKDPQRRPGSALVLAALLSGGDPLAATLAAGETPSPELVAAAGESEGLRPRVAWAWFAALLAGLLAMPFLARSIQLHHRVPADKSPEVLEDRARELLHDLDPTPPRDRARGFTVERDYLL
jgi:serine/threonine-protein kinase